MKKPLSIAISISLALTATLGTAQVRKVTCWQEGGRQVCGDAMPASAANSARKVYNAQGVLTDSEGRVLSPAERAAADAANAARAKTEEQKAREAREQMALAESYPSEQDLNRAYQLRKDVSKGSLVAAEASLTTQRKALIAVLHQAAETELTGKPVAKAQADAVQSQRNALVSTMNSLQRMREENARIDTDYHAAVVRYRKAKQVPMEAPVMPLAD